MFMHLSYKDILLLSSIGQNRYDSSLPAVVRDDYTKIVAVNGEAEKLKIIPYKTYVS